MVLVGGNRKKKKVVAGQTGKILKFLPKKNRVIVEGVNFVKRHKRALSPQDTAGIIQKEGSIHISNVMFYAQDLKRPVRISYKTMKDGRKVRGFRNPKTNDFEQIDT